MRTWIYVLRFVNQNSQVIIKTSRCKILSFFFFWMNKCFIKPKLKVIQTLQRNLEKKLLSRAAPTKISNSQLRYPNKLETSYTM
jgi:hypothetical protein